MRPLITFLLVLGMAPALADEMEEPPSQLADLLGSNSEGFARALEPRDFAFPADHGPHPAFRNEWWYVTGNLDNQDGGRFGFELTIFRFSLAPDIAPSNSAWRTNQLYIAHLALTDAEGEQFFTAQRYSRGALGLAGAEASPFRVWIDDWRIEEDAQGAWRLVADDDEFGIDVRLQALKPPVLNGTNGLPPQSARYADEDPVIAVCP